MRLFPLLVATALLAGPKMAAAERPEVVLVRPGAGEKTKLRLHPKKGSTQTAVFDMGMTMALQMGAIQTPPTVAPRTVMTMKVVVDDVAANGDIGYSFEITDVRLEGDGGMPPDAVAQMRAGTRELVGTKGSAKVSSVGENLGATFELPPTVSAGARQTLEGMRTTIEQMSAPMPKEPVGAGAKWKVAMTTDAMGLAVRQTTLYTLKSIEGDRIVLETQLEQSAAPGASALPGLPPGLDADLVSMSSKGGGTLSLDLSRLLPVKSDLGVAMDMHARVDAGQGEQDMKMSMKMDVKILSKE